MSEIRVIKSIKNLNSAEFYRILMQVSHDITKTATLSEALLTLVRFTALSIGCERGTIFLHDDNSHELYSYTAQGNLLKEIRIPDDKGLAGWSYTYNEPVIVSDAYNDARFNSDTDRATGFVTKSILCVPLRSVTKELIGVSQMLNKTNGEFTESDVELVKVMTEQASQAIQNKLVVSRLETSNKDDLKNYNESIIDCLPNGVIAVNKLNKIVTCNTSGMRIFNARAVTEVKGKELTDFFINENAWVSVKIRSFNAENNTAREVIKEAVVTLRDEKILMNMTLLPLVDANHNRLGSLVLIDYL
ncbi:MAG: GAF domain-containing protein [Gammaproteobacteria bacterium]|nr:GAF domain-containing protein [Gammaproteobacteria bacterium]